MGKHIRTSFCIICGKDFSDTVKPSKEHIIPAALGNKKMITYCICEKCNNAMGSYVDSYLTDYVLVKLIRKNKLEKDKGLHVYNSIMSNDKGVKYRITDKGPEILPKIEKDEEGQKIHLEVPSPEEGRKIAANILKRDYKKSPDEISEILSDPSRFVQHEIQYSEAGVFTQDAELDCARFKLAAIKIAYEYAVEKIGECYTIDESASILRAYLMAGREGKKAFSKIDFSIISSYCHCGDAFAEVAENASEVCQYLSGGQKVNHMISICRSNKDNLICWIRILDESFLSFTVFLSNDANKYLTGRNGFMAFITDNGKLYEV